MLLALSNKIAEIDRFSAEHLGLSLHTLMGRSGAAVAGFVRENLPAPAAKRDHFFNKSIFFAKKYRFFLEIQESHGILGFIPRGVVANRLGNGLQNRIDRFDSGPRLHFFVFKKSFSKISEYSP